MERQSAASPSHWLWEQYLDGYVNVDYPPSEHNVMQVKADVYANVTELDFPAGSVDEVGLHHVFEHFNRVTALAMLIKWHNWLKIGGKLHIETPDLAGSAKTLLSGIFLEDKDGSCASHGRRPVFQMGVSHRSLVS